MRKYIQASLLCITALFYLSGCSASFDKEETETMDVAENAFKEDAKKPNNETEEIEYYLPFGFEVEDESPNNIILKNGSKTYILFYNPIEGQDSEIVYQSTIEQEKYDTDKVIKQDNKYGYLLIRKIDDKLNELTVGVGGMKITTETKTRSLSSEADMMIDIVNSIKLK
jgi:hypothetical protein